MNNFEDILEYIPQRPPFVMVDELVFSSDKQTTTNFTILSENLFCENGVFYEAGLIENIAQSVAAGSGYKSKQKNENAPNGMIGSIKKLQIRKRPGVGVTINTVVNLIADFDNALVIEGCISVGNEIIASCQMNVFLLKNTSH
jgi:predicted hotdog family 3-hydroxylacyl-ACP dehydratase